MCSLFGLVGAQFKFDQKVRDLAAISGFRVAAQSRDRRVEFFRLCEGFSLQQDEPRD